MLSLRERRTRVGLEPDRDHSKSPRLDGVACHVTYTRVMMVLGPVDDRAAVPTSHDLES